MVTAALPLGGPGALALQRCCRSAPGAVLTFLPISGSAGLRASLTAFSRANCPADARYPRLGSLGGDGLARESAAVAHAAAAPSGLVIVPASRSCTYSRRAWFAASFAVFGRRARRSACH